MNRDLLQICSFCVYGPRAVKQNKCHSVGSPTPSSSSSPPRTPPGTRPLDGLVLLTWAFGVQCLYMAHLPSHMERGRRSPDPAACALLASGQTPAAFADIVAHSFFPALDMAPPPFTAQNCLPAYAEDIPGPVRVQLFKYHKNPDDWAYPLGLMVLAKAGLLWQEETFFEANVLLVAPQQRQAYLATTETLAWFTIGEALAANLPYVPPDEAMALHIVIVVVMAGIVLEGQRRRVCLLWRPFPNPPWWVYGLPVVLLSSAAGAAVMGLSAGYKRHLVQAIKAGAHEYEEIVCQSVLSANRVACSDVWELLPPQHSAGSMLSRHHPTKAQVQAAIKIACLFPYTASTESIQRAALAVQITAATAGRHDPFLPPLAAPARRSTRDGHRRSASTSLINFVSPSLLTAAAIRAHDLNQKCADDRTRQWLALKAPIPGWPQQPHYAPVVDTAGQPTQAENIVAAAPVSTAQAGIPKEPVNFPLPPGSDEEGVMDLSHTRKRNHDDDSSDEEQMAPKKLPVPLSSPENHDEDKAKSSDLSAQSGGSTACPPTARSLDGASSATTASTSEAHDGGAATAEDSSSDTTALLAKSTLTATQDLTASDGDDMEEDHEAEDCAARRKGTKAAPTAADFLRTAKTRAPARKAKKRSKKGKKATRQQQAPATQAKAAYSSQDTTPAAPPPPAEEDFKEVCSKAASCRARKLESAALPVDSAVVGTVLFKPSAPGGSFKGSPRLTLAQVLSSRPGVAAIRVNHQRNIVAADVTTRECLEQLLALTELRGIAVKAKQPADRLTSIGYLHGVDGEPDNASLLSGLQSTLPVLSATREGSTVTLRFAGPVPPQHVKLFLQDPALCSADSVGASATPERPAAGPTVASDADVPTRKGRHASAQDALTVAAPMLLNTRLSSVGAGAQSRDHLGHFHDSPFKESGPSGGTGGGARNPNPQAGDLLLPVALDWTPNARNLLQVLLEEPLRILLLSMVRQPLPRSRLQAPPAVTPTVPGPAATTPAQNPLDSLAEILLQAMSRPAWTAIDVSLATPGASYGWATEPGSWGSDHLPIVITPAGGKVPRTRRYAVVDWRLYRHHLDTAPEHLGIFEAMAGAAEAATTVTSAPANQPAADLHHLNLKAARRRAERAFLRGGCRTLFNRLNAACRRHANQRWRQGWVGICQTVSRNKGGSRAWRLLRSLLVGPSTLQPVLSLAIALNIREDTLAEQFADRFAAAVAVQPATVINQGAPCLPQGHHPAWAADQRGPLPGTDHGTRAQRCPYWGYGLSVVLLSSVAAAAVMALSAGYKRHLVQAIKAGAHGYEETTAPLPSLSNCLLYFAERPAWAEALLGLSVLKGFIYNRDASYVLEHINAVPEADRPVFTESANFLIFRTVGDLALASLPDVPPDEQMVAHVLLVVFIAVIVPDGQRSSVSLLQQVLPNLPKTSPAPSVSNCLSYYQNTDDWAYPLTLMAFAKAGLLWQAETFFQANVLLVAPQTRQEYLATAQTLLWFTIGEALAVMLPYVPPDEAMAFHIVIVVVMAGIVLEGQRRRVCLLWRPFPNPPWWVYGLPLVLFSSAAGAAVMGLAAGYKRHLLQEIKAGAHEYEEIVCQSE
ncbi:hypothetical protein HPB52_004914 [Rhipicephalus sanguineus]|uniref:Uncharacterized protein n=1 Tax=Rhipicephalus sanguineus TaxID=34632 RepID=A0A9D4SRZ9_RHISA|nr:hypothetical protein HPB52_004914 [Rhipicephalus sanguineus]